MHCNLPELQLWKQLSPAAESRATALQKNKMVLLLICTFAVTVLFKFPLLKVRVTLYLVASRHNLDSLQKTFCFDDGEVGDANGLHKPLTVQLFHTLHEISARETTWRESREAVTVVRMSTIQQYSTCGSQCMVNGLLERYNPSQQNWLWVHSVEDC